MIYRILRAVWRFALRIYFRDLRVEGGENIPDEGPVLLVANHTNAFVDALVIMTSSDRRITLTAKSVLRNNPLLAPLIFGLGVILLHRSQDTELGTDPSRNDDAIARCAEALADGHVLCVFPEGVSHSDGSIRPFRTGAARIALRALESDLTDLPVVPVGLYFEAKERLRSDALVRFGRPIVIRRDDGDEDVRRLTDLFESEVRAITLNFESRREELLVDWAADLVDAAPGRPLALDRETPDVSRRAIRIEKLQTAWKALRTARPAEVSEIVQQMREMRRELLKLGLDPKEVFLPLGPAQAAFFMLREGELLVFGLPIVIVAALIHGLPWAVTRAIVMMTSRDRDHWATNALFFGLVAWPVCIAFELILVAMLAGTWFAVLAALIAPFVLVYGVLWVDRIGSAVRRVRSFFVLAISAERRKGMRNRVAGLGQRIRSHLPEEID